MTAKRTRRPAGVAKAVAAERERILKIVEKVWIPLDGFDRYQDRSSFAAFNMGRLQMAICLAIHRS